MPEDSDYYDAGPAAGTDPNPVKPGSNKTKPDDKDQEPEVETTLLPKALFGGKTPDVGGICQFKVEHVWEDEIEVSYVKEGGEEKSDTGKPHSTMDTATDAFDQMAAPASTPE